MIKNILRKLKKKNIEKDKITLLREAGCKIGNNCEIYKTAYFGTEPYLIKIGDNVRISGYCNLITHDGSVWVIRNLYDLQDIDLMGTIEIGNNVNVGMNVTILPNVKIGNNVIVGCNSIVTKSIPDNEVWAGIPARKIETVEEYYNKNKDRFVNTKHLDCKEKEIFLKNYFNK